MYRIACLDPHEAEVKKVLYSVLPEGFSLEVGTEGTLEERIKLARDADFVLAGWTPVERQVLESGSKIRMVQKMGIGCDKIDLAKAEELGITVAITAGSNAIPVAEHALLLMLAVYRKLPYVERALREGRWLKNRMRAETRLLTGKTVGLLGFGNIARHLCRLLNGFSNRILYYDIVRATEDQEQALGAEFCESVDTLISSCDVLSIHVPLVKSTRHLINAGNIGAFREGAILINTSRGGVVEEQALYGALVNGPLAGAGIDVFEVEPSAKDNPLFTLDNVVVTPHMAGAVLDNVANVARHSFGNMVKVANGEPLRATDVMVKGRAQVA